MVSFSFCSTLNITNTVLIQQSCNLNCDFGLRKCQRRKQLTRRFDEPRWQLSPGLLRSGNGKKMKKEPQHPSGILDLSFILLPMSELNRFAKPGAHAPVHLIGSLEAK